MEKKNATILVADDEPLNLEILTEHLQEVGYEVVTAHDGAQAWTLISADPKRFHTILLDRMMPNMGGMEVLAKIKAHPKTHLLPVILQTAKAAKQEVLEGLQAGAYYYLTKPFDKATMLAIVKTAVNDQQNYQLLQDATEKTARTLSLLTAGQFSFKTIEEGQDLAALLSNAHTIGSKIVIGLSELLINAVEHGNLDISYQEKSKLNENGTWKDEIEYRLSLPENKPKSVQVVFTRTDTDISFLIQDQGNGFDWESYLEISPERAFDNHGRGIAMARMLSFDQIEYKGKGNEVLATVSLAEDE